MQASNGMSVVMPEFVLAAGGIVADSINNVIRQMVDDFDLRIML